MKFILYTFVLILFTACAGSKTMRSLKTGIGIQKQQLQQLSQKIDSVDDKRAVKITSGKVDETTDSISKIYLQQLKDSINNMLGYYNALVTTKQLRKNKKQLIVYLNDAQKKYDERLSNIYFLDDLFDATTFNRLNTATFFGSGEYNLTDSTAATASVILQNIIKQAVSFSQAHASKKLKAMFIVLGYADEQPISAGSALYTDLTGGFEDKDPSNKKLNLELSSRRASTLKKLIKTEFERMAADHAFAIDPAFIATGKGEEFPSGSIKDYTPDDERRRVVLIYWSILPELN